MDFDNLIYPVIMIGFKDSLIDACEFLSDPDKNVYTVRLLNYITEAQRISKMKLKWSDEFRQKLCKLIIAHFEFKQAYKTYDCDIQEQFDQIANAIRHDKFGDHDISAQINILKHEIDVNKDRVYDFDSGGSEYYEYAISKNYMTQYVWRILIYGYVERMLTTLITHKACEIGDMTNARTNEYNAFKVEIKYINFVHKYRPYYALNCTDEYCDCHEGCRKLFADTLMTQADVLVDYIRECYPEFTPAVLRYYKALEIAIPLQIRQKRCIKFLL